MTTQASSGGHTFQEGRARRAARSSPEDRNQKPIELNFIIAKNCCFVNEKPEVFPRVFGSTQITTISCPSFPLLPEQPEWQDQLP